MANARVAPGVHFARAGHDSSSKRLRYGLAGTGDRWRCSWASSSEFSSPTQHWPYRYRIVKPLLEEVLGSQIVITHYHRTYFPHPGFVAEGITLRRKSAADLPPLGSVEQLAVQGTWIDLFLLRKRVKLVDIQRLHVVVPAPAAAPTKRTSLQAARRTSPGRIR